MRGNLKKGKQTIDKDINVPSKEEQIMQLTENKEKRPEFLKIDNMGDGKGGSILLSVLHIVSVRYFLPEPSRPSLELRLIDGSDIRICGEKAAKL